MRGAGSRRAGVPKIAKLGYKSGMKNERALLTPVATEQAPKAIGPYSQAIAADAGESPGVPVRTDRAVAEHRHAGGAGDVRAEAEQVMQNLRAVLAAAGCSFADVVKTTIFLADMADFAAVNEVYGRALPEGHRPARATVQVAGLPRGARVEIDAIALRPSS